MAMLWRHRKARESSLEGPVEAPALSAPQPPSLATVVAAGYKPEVAAGIVAAEQAKAAAGEKPYGDKEPSTAKQTKTKTATKE